jgi:hypothetical protein
MASSTQLPIFGYLTLSQKKEIDDQVSAAFGIFTSRQMALSTNGDPYLTGRYVTVGPFGRNHGEIVTLAQIEWVEGVPDSDGEFASRSHAWVDVSDGSYAGDSLDEILETMSCW